MTKLTRMAWLLGMAGSLAAQSGTLSFGEITLVTPVTSPPTYVVNIVLTTSGATICNGVACGAGAQFDLNYDPTQLTVTVGLGASATQASEQLSTVMLTSSLSNPFCVNPGSCVQPQNNGPGQRVIIIGCCSTAQINNPPNGPNPPTNSTIADGVVATLTVQPAAAATTQTLTILPGYLGATTAGGQGSAAQPIPMIIGAGSSDPKATGIVNLANTYQVGDTYPFTGDNLGTFGNGLDINDAIQVLFAVDSVTGYSDPGACTDRFDAMDSYPQDTVTVRGGNGIIDINDAIVTLFRVDSVQGYSTHPVRTSLGEDGTCPKITTAKIAFPNRQPASKPPIGGTLVLGPAEPSGNGQARVPVYLQGGRDLPRLAFTFGLGDMQSHLQFQADSALAPTIVVDRVQGVIVAAWLGGLDVRAGQRVLLGYVVAPAGAASNLKVFGTSATGLNDHELVGLDVSGAQLVQQ